MTEEEKKAADEKAIADKAIADAKAAEDAKGGAAEIDPLKEKDEIIAKLTEDLTNYKRVALKRLGKLPGDADFVEGADPKTGLTVEEQVAKTLLERDAKAASDAKDAEIRRIQKENSELKLAIKNRPGGSIGGEGGSIVEVKDNVFSPAQIAKLTEKAILLKADPAKFIENAKKNLQSKQ